MLDNVFFRATGLSALLAAAAAHAGPVTTVPWNGYTGATSFGYDDTRPSQLSTAIPALDKLGMKGTFFLTNGAGYKVSTSQSQWIAAGKNGHELASHTLGHQNTSEGDDQIAKMVTLIQGLDPSFEAVTFAYPNCAVGGQNTVGQVAFLGRGCQGIGSTNKTYYNWSAGSEPTWMNILGYCIQPSNAGEVKTFLDGAKTNNSWAPIFTHDVSTSPDQYSATTSDHQAILQRAADNKLWVGTWAEVGAYYRAHFTMDKLTANSGAGPWNLKWTSPHSKMPKSVKLKVKLDAATFGSDITVSQSGTVIPKNTDGSYTIDFMKLAMDVKKGTSGVANRAINLEGVKFRREANGLAISGAPQARISVWTLSGTQVGLTEMDAYGTGWLALGNAASGSLVVRVAAPDGASSALVLPPMR
ncbi:MAG TPA: polysaccharide deacetylase family protein [Fibrobacteria bacterium]|nr:polysaccharide deacetylase family protein [Fibrobacteria bacterium]